jgi:hypothetical protein
VFHDGGQLCGDGAGLSSALTSAITKALPAG